LAGIALGAGGYPADVLANDPSGALGFIRVIGDVRVEYTQSSKPPVVREGVEVATGSGFVIAPSGLVLTNRHVVELEPVERGSGTEAVRVSVETRRIEVALGDHAGRRSFEGSLVASDADLDLAVLQVTATDLPYVPFGDSDAVEPGRPVKILGFPFGRQVEVGRRPDRAVVPGVSVTAGTLSAARQGDGGETRYLQTDASIQPGSSGGPMIDEEGYAVGVVAMKLARDAAGAGAGFGVPINLVKDFLEGRGLSSQLPAPRLQAGVLHSLDWKGMRAELPAGLQDTSRARLRVSAEDSGSGVSLEIARVATAFGPDELERAVLGAEDLEDFLPAPASAVRRLDRAGRARILATARGTTPGGAPFRVEYVLLTWPGEAVVGRYLGPPDVIAFNLGVLRRSLESLQADRLLTAPVRAPLSSAFEPASLSTAAGGPFPVPRGWSVEPPGKAACEAMPPAESGVAAAPTGDFTVVLRASGWSRSRAQADRALRACGASGGEPSTADRGRRVRLGVEMESLRVEMPRGREVLLLELLAPAAKMAFARPLYEQWVAAFAEAPRARP
jgi:S1-C subfamily serine protease